MRGHFAHLVCDAHVTTYLWYCKNIPQHKECTMASSPSIHLSYLYAQKLNNNAALLVEIGQDDKAIASLSKALKLWRAHNLDEIPAGRGICRCPHCTPDGCIIFSEINDPELDISNASDRIINTFRQPSDQHDSDSCDNNNNNNDNDIVLRIKKVKNGDDDDNNDEEQMDFGCGYMYRQLIRMPYKSLLKGHNMGSALPLIIIFNLGIAYHLSAITSTNRAKIEKTLQLYQVANNCLGKYLRDTTNNQNYCAAAWWTKQVVLYNSKWFYATTWVTYIVFSVLVRRTGNVCTYKNWYR